MIHNVYIVKTDGTCLIQRKYGSLEVDESLISGFITAINTFAEQIIQRQVDEIVMGDLKFIYSRSGKLDVIYAICSDSDAPSDDLKNIFDQVDQKFVEQYEEIFKDNLIQDAAIFDGFILVLDEIIVKSTEGREGRFHISKNVSNMFKKLIHVITFTKRPPEEASVEAIQDTTLKITRPEGEEELNQIYAINEDVIKNVSDIPTEDVIQRMALQYINGRNSVEDVILSLQLLGYKPSSEKLLEFFKERENAGYLKPIGG